MTRLRATLALGLVMAGVLGFLGSMVRVPFVALGDGPTVDVLAQRDGRDVVTVGGPVETFPVSGQLRMTTVALTTDVTLFGAMGMWATGSRQVVPREEVYPPGQSNEEVDAENTRQFTQSETDAEAAALRHLGYPAFVQVGGILDDSPSTGVLAAGDRILEVDGRPVATPAEVVRALSDGAAGRPVSLRTSRGGAPPADVVVTPGARPDGAPGAFLGITPTNVVDSPADITISLGEIGGPSAGLIFATAVVDKMTPGDLLGGRSVAGTGTIDATGAVGSVGGVPFKMDAARRQGATLFLVPAANCDEALRDPPEGLTLARVGTLDEGLTAVSEHAAGRPPVPC